ncbi:MFS transporter [Natronosporangium hydrolyticum]|uniref:MFS transporter n=1 Tax=Natronosporangium hydrolyticum TaxID=2811111 RepID=UPI001EFA2503|nr:MFS transporter [Natronosporangium hydrolyticum]
MPLRSRLGLLAQHDFRQLFASTTVSQIGLQITQLAMSLVAIDQLGAGEFEAGLLITVQFSAFLLMGLPAGALVDRLRRRSVLIASDLGRAVLLVSVPVAWWAELLTIWHLYLVAFGYGAMTVFFDAAYQSYLPHLVGRRGLVEGNAKLEAVRAVSQTAGPGLAGQLVRLLGAPVALFVDALTMAASVLFYARIRSREQRPARQPGARLRREIAEGLRFVFGQPLLRAIVMCTGTFNLFFALYTAMLIFFLRRDLEIGPGAIGLVLSIFSLGGLLGAVFARRFASWVGQGRAIWMSTAFGTPFLLLMPFAEVGWRLWLAAAASAVAAAGGVIYKVTQVSFRQALTPDHLLGRMNATVRFLVWGAMPVGGLLGAVLGDRFGARVAVGVAVVGMCSAFLPVFLSGLRSMRTLPVEPVGVDRPSPDPDVRVG